MGYGTWRRQRKYMYLIIACFFLPHSVQCRMFFVDIIWPCRKYYLSYFICHNYYSKHWWKTVNGILLKTIYIIRIKYQRQWKNGERLYSSFFKPLRTQWRVKRECTEKTIYKNKTRIKKSTETHTYVFDSIFHLMHLCCLLFIRARCSIIVRHAVLIHWNGMKFSQNRRKVHEIAFNGVFSSYIIVLDVLTFDVEMLDLMSNSTVNIHMKGCLLRFFYYYCKYQMIEQ